MQECFCLYQALALFSSRRIHFRWNFAGKLIDSFDKKFMYLPGNGCAQLSIICPISSCFSAIAKIVIIYLREQDVPSLPIVIKPLINDTTGSLEFYLRDDKSPQLVEKKLVFRIH